MNFIALAIPFFFEKNSRERFLLPGSILSKFIGKVPTEEFPGLHIFVLKENQVRSEFFKHKF